jgi:hypothetical protein
VSAVATSTVDRLIDVAVTAMQHTGEEFSDLELLSACFTIALRTANVVQRRHPELQPMIMQAAQLVLLNCADEQKLN